MTTVGQCLLDMIRPQADRAGRPSQEYYSPREIKLLRRFATWMKTVNSDRLRAMEILLEDLSTPATERKSVKVRT